MTVLSPARRAVPLEPPAVDYPADGSVAPVGRFRWVPVETAAPPVTPAEGLRGRSVAVVGGDAATARSVVAALRAAGAVAHRLEPGADEADPATVTAGVAAFRAGAARLDGIVDLNVAGEFDPAHADTWRPRLRQSVALLQSVYADWFAEQDANRVFYLTVTRLGGQHGFGPATMSQPLGGIWAGLAKGLPRELPNCNVRVLDLAPEHVADTAALVCRELYRWDLYEVGYRAGRRYTLVARPRLVGPPRVTLDPDDVVLMSGGGRGIGFALARALATSTGCRVVVTGRGPLPDPADPVLSMSADEFRRHRDERLRWAAAHRSLPQVRAELDRAVEARELTHNLATARADDLDVEYQQCDIVDPGAVAGLLDGIGDRLAGIIHNAGVDAPVRLPTKTLESVTTVVQVKVQGFLNLAAALAGRPAPAFFCNVGSLTGRFGGMIGQLDYGAANEGLSRLGLWAAQPVAQPGRGAALPVTTMCWPTWERLGMITNYEATLRYMSAVHVDEGLYHWQRELVGGGTGEVSFIGKAGSAMAPGFLRGYPHDPGLPGIDRLTASRFFLGIPQRFRPFESIVSSNALSTRTMPCCTDFLVDGEPALPVSFCLAYLLSTGEWVLPEPRAGVTLDLLGMRGTVIDLAALRAGPGREEILLRKEASGRWVDGRWLVSAALYRLDTEMARAELVYATEPGLPLGAHADPATAAPDGTPAGWPVLPSTTVGRLHWRGHVFRLGSARRAPGNGDWAARVEADRMGDLLTASPAPRPPAPLNQIETLVRAAYQRHRATGGADPDRITIAELRVDPGTDPDARGATLTADPTCGSWTGRDTAGRVRLRVDGLRFR